MKRKYIFYSFIALIIVIAFINLNYYIKFSSPQYGFSKECIKGLNGCVIQDSTLSSYQQKSVLIKLKYCINHNGDVASACGVIRCTYKGYNLYSGDCVTLYGKFNDYGFKAKLLDYKRPTLNLIRAYLLNAARAKLGTSKEVNLACMLLLGFSLEYDTPIKEKARLSGTSHVLALSGMHLVFFSTIITILFYPLFREYTKHLGLIFLYIYVLIVGPKPSLIRAVIFRTCCILFKGKNNILLLLITFCIQSCIALSTIGEIATMYSYSALLGIFIFFPIFNYLTPRFKPFFSYFTISYCAMVFTSFISLKYFNSFYLGGILISGLLSPILFTFMTIGLISIFYMPGVKLLESLYHLFSVIMDMGCKCGKVESLKGYIIFLIPLLCILLLFCILKLRRLRYVEPKL